MWQNDDLDKGHPSSRDEDSVSQSDSREIDMHNLTLMLRALCEQSDMDDPSIDGGTQDQGSASPSLEHVSSVSLVEYDG